MQVYDVLDVPKHISMDQGKKAGPGTRTAKIPSRKGICRGCTVCFLITI